MSSKSEDECKLRRGPWTLEEDTLLVHYIAVHGEGRWNLLAQRSGLRRTGKSCRLRWLNYLKPDVKRGNLTPQEQLLILDLHSKWGNRWSKIAQHLPGRTDNEIKNYWRTRVQKQAKNLKVDANSTTFQEIIKRLWIPRLLQKIHGSPNISSSSSSVFSLSYAPNNNLSLPPPPPPPQEVGRDHNSDSDLGSSNSCISSTESMNISNLSQLSEYNGNYHEHVYVDTNYYNMGTMNMVTMSVPPGFDDSAGCRHVAETDWIGCDLGDNMWSMDDFMQIQ